MATQTSGIGLDSCLSKTKTQVIDIDSIIRKLRYQMHTMVSNSVRTFVSKGF